MSQNIAYSTADKNDVLAYGFPFALAVEGYPAIGHLPLAQAKPAADAYRAVLDRLTRSSGTTYKG
ncbi:DUF7691 family protein [Streptomyces zagrosensis]|uniref:DUF7691 domain-containing protein n=1 Tax=Streptomyces zagrosensis TaxID=1042984 RepID=A0A7W9QFU6_9ACTN|nr:hypothetical protein [Streptomyces zagrosensis]MBB5939336.1 hypothetical protein [Streptomyces zagrosensis]